MNNPLIIQKLYLYNFRGLHELTLDNLSCVNVFVGTNNSGKTSVLEAIKLLGAPDDVGQIVRLALQRAQASAEARKNNLVNYILSIFQKEKEAGEQENFYRIKLAANIRNHLYSYEADGTVGEVVDSSGNSKKSFGFSIKTAVDSGKTIYKPYEIINGEEKNFSPIDRSLFSSLYLHSTISYYRSCVTLLTDYIVDEGKAEVLHILQTFDDNIDDISIVGEDIYLHNTHSGSMPLFSYGAGLQKAVLLTVAIAYYKGGVILIDEIDNAIHVSAFEDVFRWFLNACIRWNVQAFITTHSAEALDAIISIVHNEHSGDDVLRIVTLRQDYSTNITKKRIRSGEEAYSDRECFKMELRV